MQPKFTRQSLMLMRKIFAIAFLLLIISDFSYGQKKQSRNNNPQHLADALPQALGQQNKGGQNILPINTSQPSVGRAPIQSKPGNDGIQPNSGNPTSRAFCYNGAGPFQLNKQSLLNTTLTPVGATVSFGFPGAAAWNTLNNKMYVVDQAAPFALYTVDTLTGVRTFIANCTNVPQANLTGMTWDQTTNTMYGASTTLAVSQLFTINILTGVCTPIGSPSTVSPGLIALNAAPGGSLFSTDIVTDNLYKWNKATGVATLVGPCGFDLNFGQDGHFDMSDGQYFLCAYNNTVGQAQLRIVDTLTGASTLVGAYGGQVETLAIYSLPLTPCSGTPTPGNTVSDASGNTVCAGQNFNLSLSNPITTSGLNHQWQWASSLAGPWTNFPGATGAGYTTSTTVNRYYRDSVTCTNGNAFAYSTPLLITINPACCLWVYSTPIPIPILDAPAVSLGNFLYTFTAVSNNLVVTNSYKFDGTAWTAIAPFPVAAEFPSACTDGVNIYVMGGYTTAPSTGLYRYNIATNTYTQLASCSVGTWNQSCQYLNGKIYKFGGSAAVGSTNALEIYDIASNTWTTGAPMPASLSFVASMALGGYIYTAGGIDAGANTTSAKTFRYDPATNTWNDAAIADLPGDRWGASGYLYGPYTGYGSFAVAGGYTTNSTVITNTALLWDPTANSWSSLPSMATNSARFAAASLNGSYYAVGGRQTNSFVGSNFNQKLTCTYLNCSGPPTPGNTIGPSFVCIGQPFTLSLQNVPSVNGLTFQWQSSLDNVTYTDIAGQTTGIYTATFTGTKWYRCKVTCSGQTTNSNPLKVTDGQGVFTTQPPSTVPVQCGGTVSIAFAATGLSLTYAWEYRVNSSSPWQNVTNAGVYSGANTNTLTITNVTTGMSGYQYRGLMSGPCTAIDYTNIATLNVTPLVAIVNPSSATICLGTVQMLTVGNQLSAPPPVTSSFTSGPISVPVPDNTVNGVSHSIPVNLPAGASIINARVTFNMPHTWDGDMVFVLKAPNGQILNLDYFLSSTGGTGATTGFVNTVISSTGTAALSSGSNPYTGTFKADALTGNGPFGQTGPNGFLPTTNQWSNLYGTVNGNWTLAMYDGGPGDLGTLTSWTITFDYTQPTFANGIWTSNPAAPNTMFLDAAATVPYAGTPEDTIYVKPAVNTVYTVVITTPTPCTSGPTNVPVNVTTPISNLSIPATKSACVGDNATITATANGGPITWQWQVSDNNGVTYTDIVGATSATLTLNNVTQLMNNYRYRVTGTASPCGSVASPSFTTLIVNPLPTVSLSANPSQVMPGVTTFVTASSTPAAASYSWTLNGAPITGATTSSVFADVDKMGSYKVTVTDVNGCVRTSSELVVSAKDNSRLWIYPNPNNGQFQARLYTPAIYLYDVHIVTIYNAAGQILLTKTFPITSQYVRMDFDMRGYAAGVYVAKVTHHFTGKPTVAQFVIQH